MGKRSTYEPRPRDFYPTPFAAVEPLKGMLGPVTFCEPCAGDGRLATHIEDLFPESLCTLALDIEPQTDWVLEGDANNLTEESLAFCQYIITNPPFTWGVLKPLLDKWISLRPTLLLLPADFLHNKRFSPYLDKCVWVKSIGRVKWIEDSKMTGVDNFVWAMFDKNKDVDQATLFFGRD